MRAWFHTRSLSRMGNVETESVANRLPKSRLSTFRLSGSSGTSCRVRNLLLQQQRFVGTCRGGVDLDFERVTSCCTDASLTCCGRSGCIAVSARPPKATRTVCRPKGGCGRVGHDGVHVAVGGISTSRSRCRPGRPRIEACFTGRCMWHQGAFVNSLAVAGLLGLAIERDQEPLSSKRRMWPVRPR